MSNMIQSKEFRELAQIVESWNANMQLHTEFMMEKIGHEHECIVITANSNELKAWQGKYENIRLITLKDAKAGKIPQDVPEIPMLMTPLAIQQMLIDMSGVGMRHIEFAKRDAYQAMLTNSMIKPEYQKQVYIRIKEIEERT